MAWGAVSMLDGASHFVIYLARKGLNYETPYIEKLMQEVRHRRYDPILHASNQELPRNDAQLNDERSPFLTGQTNVYPNGEYDECSSLMGMDLSN